MTDQRADGAPTSHETHDRNLIAAFVVGDLAGRDLARANALVHDCPECAGLAADLHSIADATRRLPTSLPAPRDFRLSPAEAGRLGAGRWRRLLRVPVLHRWSPRPLGAALTTLGVAGLLLAAMPFMSLGPASGGAAPRDNAVTTNGGAKAAASAAPAVTPAATLGPSSTIEAAASAVPSVPEFGALPIGAASQDPCCATEAPDALAATPPPSLAPGESKPGPAAPGGPATPLLIVSAALLVAGLGLLVVGRRSTRGR